VTAQAISTEAAFAAAAEQRRNHGPSWLRQRRIAAWDACSSLAWPDSRSDEDWRRTDISKLRLTDFTTDPKPTPAVPWSAAAARGEGPLAQVTAIAGRDEVEIQDADMLTAQGIVVCSLAEACHSHPAEVQALLAAAGLSQSVFAAQWNALWQGGCFVYVPPTVEAAIPLVTVAHQAGGVASFPATLIYLSEDASLRLVDVHSSDADPGFCNSVTAMRLGRGARMTYSNLQRLGDATWHVGVIRADLEANAELLGYGASLGSRLQKVYWDIRLNGEAAHADVKAIALASNTQHLDHQTLQAHLAPHTESRVQLHTVVRDSATSVYSGLIEVAETAQHSDGYLRNRNLLLSRGARADSVPRLEIRANDVRCGHGATATHIDDEQRFYLRSRGLSAADADRIIVRGYLDDGLQGGDAVLLALVAADLDRLVGEQPKL